VRGSAGRDRSVKGQQEVGKECERVSRKWGRSERSSGASGAVV